MYLEAKELNDLGMVLDFHKLDELMTSVIARFDHQHLNDVQPFTEINPSSENLAKVIFDSVSEKIESDRVRVKCCDIWENDCSSARYAP